MDSAIRIPSGISIVRETEWNVRQRRARFPPKGTWRRRAAILRWRAL
ncbi:MAG TPA: hypothetical protein VGG32_07700 [Thermoplasmata archaeon]|jgi:hypothetical protein